MKILQFTYDTLLAAAFITALFLVDGKQVCYKDLWTGFLLFALVVSQLLIRLHGLGGLSSGSNYTIRKSYKIK